MLIDTNLRKKTAANHSVTHLLHAALKKVAGEHVKQSGSLVTSNRLRFDFSHFSPLTVDEKNRIEDMVNSWIMDDLSVKTEVLTLDEAKKKGATALFGEKYGSNVRVVSIDNTSMELCGGTHISRTGQAGIFKIVSESSVSSGIRRIEAITGKAALDFMRDIEKNLENISNAVKSPVSAVEEKVLSLIERVKKLEKDLEKARSVDHTQNIDELLEKTREINGIKVLSSRVECSGPKELREIGDRFKDKIGSGVVALGAEVDGKAILICLVTKDLAGKKAHAGKIVKKMAEIVGGGGGGRPDMAQAGGTKPKKLDMAMENVFKEL